MEDIKTGSRRDKFRNSWIILENTLGDNRMYFYDPSTNNIYYYDPELLKWVHLKDSVKAIQLKSANFS